MPEYTMEHRLQACLEGAVKDGTALHWAGQVVTRDGVSPIALAGTSDAQRTQPLREDAIYWLASASKLVITLAILHAIEAGMIKGMTWEHAFDDTDALTAILPELQVGSDHWFMHIFEGWEGPEDDRIPKLRKAEKPITLRHLLSWSCGSRGQLFDVNMTKLRESSPQGGPRLQDVMTCHTSTLAEPRYTEVDTEDSFGYGSSANDWLGVFLARALATTQRDAVQSLICKPLGIKEDDMSHYLSPARRKRTLAIHAKTNVGWTQVPLEPATAQWSDGPPADHHEFGNAGLYSTLPAYARVLQAVLTRDERILSKPHWDFVLQDDLVRRGSSMKLPTTLWTDEAAPFATADVRFDNTDLGVSLIQSVVERHPTKEGFTPGTMHWYGLSNIAWWVDPNSGLAGIVATQTVPFRNAEAVATFHEFQRTAYTQLKYEGYTG